MLATREEAKKEQQVEQFYDSYLPAVDIAGVLIDYQARGARVNYTDIEPGNYAKEDAVEKKLHIDFDINVSWTTSNLEMSKYIQSVWGWQPETFFGCKIMQVQNFSDRKQEFAEEIYKGTDTRESARCILYMKGAIEEEAFWIALSEGDTSLKSYFEANDIKIDFDLRDIVADVWSDPYKYNDYVDWKHQTVKVVPARDIDFYVKKDTQQLQYFVFSYIDFRRLAQHFGMAQTYSGFEMVESQVDAYTLLESGKIVLDDVNVQDFRFAEDALGTYPDVIDVEETNELAKLDGLLDNPFDLYEGIFGDEGEYFSEFFLTKDLLGYAKFLFGVNVKKILQHESALSGMLGGADVSTALIEEMIAAAKIKTLKFLRRRVKESATGDFILFGGAEYEEVLVQKQEEALQETLNADIQKKVEAFKFMNNKELLSSIIVTNDADVALLKEVKLNFVEQRRQETGNRFFTGTDKDIAKKTTGLYQYGVEIELEDQGVQIIRDYVTQLNRIALFFNNYYNQVSNVVAYDVGNSRFTNDIKKTFSETAQVRQNIIDFVSIVAFFDRTIDARELTNNLYKMANLDTGSPRSIGMIIAYVNAFIGKLTSYFGVLESDDPANKTGYVGNAKGSNKFIKVKKWFDQVFDASVGKDTGYSYVLTEALKDDPSRYDGLLTITKQEYLKRVGQEVDKFFPDKAAGIDIVVTSATDGREEKITTSDIAKNATAYLTPNFVMLSANALYNVSDSAKFDSFVEIEAKILRRNIGENVSKENADFSDDLKSIMNSEGVEFKSTAQSDKKALSELSRDLYRGTQIEASVKDATKYDTENDGANANVLLYDLAQHFLLDGNVGVAGDTFKAKTVSGILDNLNAKKENNYFRKKASHKTWT